MTIDAVLKVKESGLAFTKALSDFALKILLVLIFFLILTPLSMLKKLFSKDQPLSVQWPPTHRSNFISRSKQPTQFENQF